MASSPFERRVAGLPRLGLGISTEYGARHQGLDVLAFRDAHPDTLQFLEVGADLERGIDDDAMAWARRGLPTTYHFLDVNLEEPEDVDDDWVRDTTRLARDVGAAWLCGDAGLWHVGPRDRGHGTLMPPILAPESADAVAESVRHLRERSGLEVLPENPPAHVYLGPMHVLDYFARVADRADTGLLFDAAHVAVFQHVRGHAPLDGLDGFPLDRIVEMHVAGGAPFEHGGGRFIDDDHGIDVLPATWAIVESVLPRATNLRAVVVEAERNRLSDVLPLFRRVRDLMPRVATSC
jgi:uncharacterized protein (UPF0276 family)